VADEKQATDGTESGDGLWRWLLGGLAAGGIILGLMIVAYAIGYHRGEDHVAAAPAAATTTATVRTTSPASTAPPTSVTVAVTSALVTRGKVLFASDGCTACHALSRTAGAGPGLAGLAGGTTTLVNGRTVSADDAYIVRSIVDPDAEIVKGFRAGLMSAAISSHNLKNKPNDVLALAAFIKSHR
jgi:mono/diheme cytochrome c family protein